MGYNLPVRVNKGTRFLFSFFFSLFIHQFFLPCFGPYLFLCFVPFIVSCFLPFTYPFYSVVCSCLLHPCSLKSSAESRLSLISSPEHRMRVIRWQQQEHPIRSRTEPWQTLSVTAAVTAAAAAARLEKHTACCYRCSLVAQGGHYWLSTLDAQAQSEVHLLNRKF